MSSRFLTGIAGLVLSSILSTAPASAATVFTANLTGSQEVPPNASSATGFGTFILNDAMTALTYNITVSGIDFTGTQTANPNDNLSAAHIHAPGAPGVIAGVVFGFFGAPFNETNPNDRVLTPFASGVGGTVSGVWNAGEGNGTTLTAQLANLLAGNAYVNFHTLPNFPGGEIRGQLSETPLPAALSLFATGLGALGLLGWRRKKKTAAVANDQNKVEERRYSRGRCPEVHTMLGERE